MKSYTEKVFQDPFYKETYRYLGIKSLAPAGFLYDKNPTDKSLLEINIERNNSFNININKLVTNIESLISKGNAPKKAYVLLSTGSFNPVHDGHIKMMQLAKKEIEKNNMPVVGGFLSVSHDSYVFTKDERFKITASERTWLCNKMIEESDWLVTDTWEALENDYAINFTDVILRMQWLINKKLEQYNISLEIVYVFGSDNYTFLDAFISKGICVCVPRKKEQIEQCEIKKKELISFNFNNPINRLFIASLGHDISSTKIRNNEVEISYPLKESWKKVIDTNLPYLIRDDLYESTFIYRDKLNHEKMNLFKENFLNLFQSYFKEVKLLSVNKEVIIPYNEQVINLDTWVSINNNLPLRVSRIFQINSPQIYSKELLLSFPEQLRKIQDAEFNEYLLVDDDIATGFTVNYIKNLLLPKICKGVYSLNPYKDFYDIIDIRDFIMGSQYGGLLCINPLNKKVMRVPYLFPFINLISRAKIPFGEEVELTRKILDLNFLLFENTDIKVKDTPLEFQNFCEYLEVYPETSIADIIKKIKP